MKKLFIIAVCLLAFFQIIKYFYFKPTLFFGDKAPDFLVQSVSGEKLSIKQFHGDYLLLNFWGSWCLPCRSENKILNLLFTRYKEAHFKNSNKLNFLSIAIEENSDRAKNAIIEDKLLWNNHIIQTNMFESELTKLYSIKQIPFMFLIGPDGNIILPNPDIKELDDYLAHNLIKN